MSKTLLAMFGVLLMMSLLLSVLLGNHHDAALARETRTVVRPVMAHTSVFGSDGTVVIMPSMCKVYYFAHTADTLHYQVDCAHRTVLQHDSIQ